MMLFPLKYPRSSYSESGASTGLYEALTLTEVEPRMPSSLYLPSPLWKKISTLIVSVLSGVVRIYAPDSLLSFSPAIWLEIVEFIVSSLIWFWIGAFMASSWTQTGYKLDASPFWSISSWITVSWKERILSIFPVSDNSISEVSPSFKLFLSITQSL